MSHRRRARPAGLSATLLMLAMPMVLGGLEGCVATGSRQSIRAAFADELQQLRPGTDLATFRRLVSQARHVDTVFDGGQRIDIYRLDHKYKPDELPAETQTLYFFFNGEHLIRWGSAPW